MPPKQRADTLKDLRDTLASYETALARAKAPGAPPKSFEIHNGEALATAHVPSQSVYELTGVAGLPLLTAIRVEVPPLDEATARHTPEEAFIVDSVRAFVIRPNGQKDKIAFAYFLQDSETNLEDRVLPNGPAIIGDQPAGTRDAKKGTKEEVADGFAAERKLFRTRWIVGIPSAPLQLAPNSRIEVDLKQTQDIDSKPAIIKRVRLAISGDPRWTLCGKTQSVRKSIRPSQRARAAAVKNSQCSASRHGRAVAL